MKLRTSKKTMRKYLISLIKKWGSIWCDDGIIVFLVICNASVMIFSAYIYICIVVLKECVGGWGSSLWWIWSYPEEVEGNIVFWDFNLMFMKMFFFIFAIFFSKAMVMLKGGSAEFAIRWIVFPIFLCPKSNSPFIIVARFE